MVLRTAGAASQSIEDETRLIHSFSWRDGIQGAGMCQIDPFFNLAHQKMKPA